MSGESAVIENTEDKNSPTVGTGLLKPSADPQAAEALLDSIINNLPEMIFVKDLRTRQFVMFNSASEDLFGWSWQEIQAKAAAGTLPPDLAQLLFNSDNDAKLGPLSEWSIHTRQRGTRILQLKRLIINGHPDLARCTEQYLLTIAEDITERRLAEERLRQEATHDPLTHLPNRQFFLDRLSWCIEQFRINPAKRFAVLFLDIDRFKLINDSLGHTVGDLLLLDTARKLINCARSVSSAHSLESDPIVSRLGGDEFTILIENLTSPELARDLAKGIREAMRAPFQFPGREVFATVSIGITSSDVGYDQPEDVLRDADIAMYRAKAGGRNRHQIFDSSMHESVVSRLNTERDLRHAISHDEFALHYQPILDMNSGEIHSFEALIRWNHPTRGFVSPDEFVHVAEETGLIIPIGTWVLRQACRQLKIWRQSGHDLAVSVNLSRKQFFDSHLLQTIDAALAESDIPANRLNLEITETMLVECSQAISDTLEQIRDRGINLHLDDFGTGYSSLSCLHRFPINVLKIDRSFVSGIASNPDYLAIVQAIVTLAHKLRSQVVAEGIETAQQRQILHSIGCDLAQGYFFHKPLAADGVELLLRRSRAA